MDRTVDLWAYLPPFLKNFREMCALLMSETPEFQMFADECEKLIDELFIQTASAVGLSKFEQILGISPASGEGLEERRNAIMTRWYDIALYTMATLKSRIAAIQGSDNVEAYMLKDAPYELAIITQMEKLGQVENLKYIIESMIPCNLKVHSTNMIQGESGSVLYCGVGASITNMIEIH